MILHEVGLAGTGNARELGGIPIGEKRVKSGKLLRSAAITELTQGDLEKLANEYRLAYVVDFRMRIERELNPDPEIPGAMNRSLSVREIERGNEQGEKFMSEMLTSEEKRIELLLKFMEHDSQYERLYVSFLDSELGKEAYREFFQLLLELPEDRGILWHCTDGKDRTGVAAMLLLSALGASRDVILDEYLLTNEQNAAKLDGIRKKLADMELSAEQREFVLFGCGGVDERYLTAAFDWMDAAYGGTEGYLASELGVDAAARERLRVKYLG